MIDPITLDCTLRDGGYYNAWNFRPGLYNAYFRAIDDAGIDVVEMGFRLPPANEFHGAFAYTTDDFLREIDTPKRACLGVMCNGGDLIDDPVGSVDSMFSSAEQSPVELVRIAAHFHEVDQLEVAIDRLRELGYRVGLNLMQASVKATDEVKATAAKIAGWETVEVLYFADSLGDMGRGQVEALVLVLAGEWDGELGIHTHDNRSRALDNTLAALEAGVRWLDATVLGMGRGAGNCRTDFLLFELEQLGHRRFHSDALIELTEVHFRELQHEYGWGTNLLYFKSASNSTHPTYVQFMQADDRYGWAEMVHVLDGLPALGGLSFRTQNLDLAASNHAADGPGTWTADGWADGREVMIVGGGSTVEEHRGAIEAYIERNRPMVLCLNTTPPIAADLVDGFVACHPTRILFESSTIAALTAPLLAPAGLLEFLGVDGPAQVLDYGISVDPGGMMRIGPTQCVVPSRLALAYALSAATAGGAERVLLVGMDGYGAGDSRQDEVLELLTAFAALDGSVPLLALTPTTYPVPQGSVYAPRA